MSQRQGQRACRPAAGQVPASWVSCLPQRKKKQIKRASGESSEAESSLQGLLESPHRRGVELMRPIGYPPACRSAETRWSRTYPEGSRSHKSSWTWKQKPRRCHWGCWMGKAGGGPRILWDAGTYTMGFPRISVMMVLSPPRYSKHRLRKL